VRRISTVACRDKREVRPPTDHVKRLLEEAYANHAYPVKHKLRDYGMLRSFMTSRSLTWGAELIKGSDRSDTTPFPEENTVYEGCPLSGRRHMTSLSPRAPTRCGLGHGGPRGVTTQVFYYDNKYLYIHIYIYQNVFYSRYEG
jgi:hypothetical protein